MHTYIHTVAVCETELQNRASQVREQYTAVVKHLDNHIIFFSNEVYCFPSRIIQHEVLRQHKQYRKQQKSKNKELSDAEPINQSKNKKNLYKVHEHIFSLLSRKVIILIQNNI